jgi:hypothetical protein
LGAAKNALTRSTEGRGEKFKLRKEKDCVERMWRNRGEERTKKDG